MGFSLVTLAEVFYYGVSACLSPFMKMAKVGDSLGRRDRRRVRNEEDNAPPGGLASNGATRVEEIKKIRI